MDNQPQSPVTQPQPEAQMPMQTPEPINSSSKTMWFVVAILVVLVLAGGVYMLIRRSTKVMQPTTVIKQPTTQPKPTLPRSKALGIITNVVTATSLDAQGNPISPSNTFSATTKTIYLIVILNNAKVGTKIEYVRYLNGKYLDSNTLKLVKPNMTNASFTWSLIKPGATHLTGNYKVKVYTNGVFEKEIAFTIQ